jgi:hypothetical protein
MAVKSKNLNDRSHIQEDREELVAKEVRLKALELEGAWSPHLAIRLNLSLFVSASSITHETEACFGPFVYQSYMDL